MKNGGVSLFPKIIISLLFGAVTTFSVVEAFGEEWSSAQKEVWASQEAYYELWRSGDFEGLLAISHKDFTVWPYGSEHPVERLEHIDNILTYARISLFVLTPVQIRVFDNVANIYFIRRITLQEGRVYSDYAMTVWAKQAGKWLIVGEMSASYKPMSIYLPRMQHEQ